jgi:hypothetical protein
MSQAHLRSWLAQEYGKENVVGPTESFPQAGGDWSPAESPAVMELAEKRQTPEFEI